MARTSEATGPEPGRLNEAAILRGRDADRIEPRAEAAGFDPELGLFLVKLRGGFAFGFPPQAVQGLSDANEEHLSEIRLSPSGDGLHWDGLDVDVSLTGLVARALKLREWAPRIMGQVRSEAKARAARANGLKGGRPRSQTGRDKRQRNG